MPRTTLSDILQDGSREQLSQTWRNTEAAEEFGPLPAGEYVADAIAGELFTSRNGTAGYKLTFEVADGELTGRRFWHDLWLTQAAMPRAKRDLGKLGVTELEQLEQPLPAIIRCRVKLALRRGDNGAEYNRIRSFEVVGIVEPDAFAPAEAKEADAAGQGEDGPSPTNRINQLVPDPLNGQPTKEIVG